MITLGVYLGTLNELVFVFEPKRSVDGIGNSV